jgi:hypothetical protein
MSDVTMTKNKLFPISLTFVFVIGIYLVSLYAGEFVAGRDSKTGQIVIFLSVLLGMIVYYLADLLVKKYS